MIEHKYVGFICNITNYQENDAIYNVLTANGKQSFKARGIKKITSKNATSCNYFMLSEFITSSKTENSKETLKQACNIKIYKKPLEDLLVSSSYLFICNILNNVSQEINGFDMAIECFDLLEKNFYPINVLNYFLKNLCNSLGYAPNITGCVNCGNKTNLISFDFESGGFICSNCFDSQRYHKIDANILKDLYLFLKESKYFDLDRVHSNIIFNYYRDFFKNVLNLFYHYFDFVLKCM